MNALRRHPLLVAWLLFCTAAVGVEAWTWQHLRQAARRERLRLEQTLGERAALTQLNPAPSEENARAIAADLTRHEAEIRKLRAELTGRWEAPPVPAKSVEAYFEMHAFAERMSARARELGVSVKDEHFGFASHAHAGPEPAILPVVWRQCAIAGQLLDALFEAQPDALLALQRERPAGTVTGTESSDFFQPTDKAPDGCARRDAFRVEFTGNTGVLRAFLSAVAASPMMFSVCSVEAEPVAAPPVAAPGSAPQPLVASGPTRFAVVVEAIELAPATIASAP